MEGPLSNHVASLKLASVIENTEPLPSKPPVLRHFGERFLDWGNNSRLEEKAGSSYRNGWRLVRATSVAALRVDQITGDCAERLKFPGSGANANCALGSLRRMKEHGRHLRLDYDAEKKVLA